MWSGNNLVTDLITWLPSGSNLAITNEKKLSKHIYVGSSFDGIITGKPTMSTDRQSDTGFERYKYLKIQNKRRVADFMFACIGLLVLCMWQRVTMLYIMVLSY